LPAPPPPPALRPAPEPRQPGEPPPLKILLSEFKATQLLVMKLRLRIHSQAKKIGHLEKRIADVQDQLNADEKKVVTSPADSAVKGKSKSSIAKGASSSSPRKPTKSQTRSSRAS